ncbi:MAG: hypothetical protein P8L85_14585 [Rubripirellula sp.]|nr:hypothetical protein [Rubripirellula sp.]
MSRLRQFFIGTTRREIFGAVLNYTLIIALVVVGMQLKWATKSPTPREWNVYSKAANDQLYLDQPVPPLSPLVAHAGGTVPDAPEAGALRRLTHNYDFGTRLFELDFSWTADSEVVVKHDWNERSRIPSLNQYLDESPEHASLSMVYAWMEEHPEAFVVTDCKKRSLAFAAQLRMERPDLVPRFVLQVYQMKDFAMVQSQGFRDVILTLYRCHMGTSDDEIMRFAQANQPWAITIPHKRCTEGDLAVRLQQQGIPVFAHTVNSRDLAERLQTLGCYGVYSDRLAVTSLPQAPFASGKSGRRVR